MGNPSDQLTESKLETFTVHLYKGETNLNGAKKFSSGNKIIDNFVQKTLKSQASAPGSSVTVLVDNSEKQRLVVFYTISAHSLLKDDFQNTELDVGKTKIIPVVRLVMLGVDETYQGKGFGARLMRLALDNTKRVAQEIGCAGLYLEAAPNAVEFYSKLGFEALCEPKERIGTVDMFLHLDLIPTV
ncbi:GNAT family N-acetyltransferase [Vibrio cholerae]|uniref:GNAT family N-acetyltransferase n=1 Tax=Vibrio cholerae TaxID=666 RepID=UPI00115C111E|nr:GNAT family N-acetyltransferase [Vibrio cholerae]TQP76608.1 GNAT family N-acetyltransferase [Vibrio cholerae]